MVQACTIRDEVVNPVTPRKYIILNENFLLCLHYLCQERNPGIKQDLPVLIFLMLHESLDYEVRL
jgi:hypothetical protein